MKYIRDNLINLMFNFQEFLVFYVLFFLSFLGFWTNPYAERRPVCFLLSVRYVARAIYVMYLDGIILHEGDLSRTGSRRGSWAPGPGVKSFDGSGSLSPIVNHIGLPANGVYIGPYAPGPTEASGPGCRASPALGGDMPAMRS